MIKGTDTYLQLLRAACLGTPAVVSDPAELPSILWLCQIHGTGPLIYNELLKTLSPETSPMGNGRLVTSEQAMQMKQACLQNMLVQGQWEQVLAKVWNAFEEHNAECKLQSEKVHAVLMKGFSYARMYPLSHLRAWGDLDVWVGPEQYHNACRVLREAFPEAKHHDEEWDELKHYCFVFPNGMAIELHRVSMDFLDPKDQAYWNSLSPSLSHMGQGGDYSIEVGGVRVPVFEPKYDLLFCFMHSWEHFCGTGIPLKQVCDTTLLVLSAKSKVQSAELEAYLEKHLKALRMLEVWRYYGYMACKVMGMSFSEWPLLVQNEERDVQGEVVKYGERLYEHVLMEGQCRKKDYGDAADKYEARENARKMNILARKWLTLRSRIEKARFLYQFAPRYAKYVLRLEVKKGVRRTIRREKMIDY